MLLAWTSSEVFHIVWRVEGIDGGFQGTTSSPSDSSDKQSKCIRPSGGINRRLRFRRSLRVVERMGERENFGFGVLGEEENEKEEE